MYGSNEKKDLRQDTKYFANGGIHNNVTLKSVVFENAKKDGSSDKNVLRFTLVGPNEEILTHTEWAQEGDDKMKNQTLRLRRWVKEVTGNDTFGTQFSSWEDCAKQFLSALGDYSTQKFQIKLLYNDKGFLEMPKYDSFVRNMNNATLSLSPKEEGQCVKKKVAPSTEEEIASGAPLAEDF